MIWNDVIDTDDAARLVTEWAAQGITSAADLRRTRAEHATLLWLLREMREMVVWDGRNAA